MVTADSAEETQGELMSLQNKGVAMKPDILDDLVFVFCSRKESVFRAFVLQFIFKHWMDSEMLELYKGEKGGFYPDAVKYATEKFNSMKPARWLRGSRRMPETYSIGRIC